MLMAISIGTSHSEHGDLSVIHQHIDTKSCRYNGEKAQTKRLLSANCLLSAVHRSAMILISEMLLRGYSHIEKKETEVDMLITRTISFWHESADVYINEQ